MTGADRLCRRCAHRMLAHYFPSGGCTMQGCSCEVDWQAPEAEKPKVYRLPPEPPVGTVVEVLCGGWAGNKFRRTDTEFKSSTWGHQPDGGAEFNWWQLLRMAGPDGVRVVEEGQ